MRNRVLYAMKRSSKRRRPASRRAGIARVFLDLISWSRDHHRSTADDNQAGQSGSYTLPGRTRGIVFLSGESAYCPPSRGGDGIPVAGCEKGFSHQHLFSHQRVNAETRPSLRWTVLPIPRFRGAMKTMEVDSRRYSTLAYFPGLARNMPRCLVPGNKNRRPR